MKTTATTLGASILFLLKALAADPTPLIWRSPNPTSGNINALTFANGKYVALAEDDGRGNLLISTNGAVWSFARCPTTSVLRGITFGAGGYVAVGDGGGVFTSADAVTWTTQNSGTTNPLFGIAYGAGKFVAVGGQNRTQTILSSSNGTNWFVQTFTDATAYSLHGVAFGNGTWVAVGDPWYDKAPVFVSSNALDWTNRAVTVFPYLGFKAVVHGPAGFTAVGDGSENRPPILYSPDGIAWTQVSVSNSWYLYLNAVCAANGKLVAAGRTYYYGDDVPALTTSLDATNWSRPLRLPPAASFSGIAASEEGFMAGGSTGTLAASPDGINWSLLSTATTALSAIHYANGRFLAVGNVGNPCTGATGPGVVADSADGVTWAFTQVNNNQYDSSMYDVIYANGLYVAVGGNDGGNIVTSPDRLTWTFRTPGVGAYRAVTCGPSGFVAVGAFYLGSQAAIASSPDGIEWTNRNSGLTNGATFKYLNGVACGQGRYVAVGLSGSVVYSDDAVRWQAVSPGTSADLYDVLFTNGIFVAVGNLGSVRTSADGIAWKAAPTGFTDTLYGVAYGNGTYVAVGTAGTLAISTNAQNWLKLNSGTSANLLNAVYGNGTFVVVGERGVILQSRNFRPGLAASRVPGGVAVTLVSGESGAVYRLQAAPNLSFSSPTDVLVYSNTASPLIFTDTSTTGNPQRFYRLISP